MAAVLDGVYTKSSLPGVRCRRRFVRKALKGWDQEPYPPTTDKITRVAAVLKSGGYRSAENYLGQ